MKKFTWLFIFFLIILGVFLELEENIEFGNPNDYARITEVDYKAEVVDEYGSNGKVIVTERLTFDIHAASKDNLFWELWRDLPEEYVDGVKFDYKVNYVKQVFEDKPDVTYKESPKLYWDDDDFINTAAGYGPGKWYHSKGPYDGEYNFECVLFYVDGLYRETVVFEIQYEMYNASLRYLDSSELYISLYSGNTIKYLNSFKGQILVPSEKMPGNNNYNAYTYGTNSHTFAFTESNIANPGYHTFAFELDASQLKFKPYNQYIEFALISHGTDKHKFTRYAAVNDYSNSNMLAKIQEEQAKYEALPENYKKFKGIVLLVSLGGTFLSLVIALAIKKYIKTKYSFYDSSMKMDYFRDIPSELDPNFAAALVFCKHKSTDDVKDGYSAIMLSLTRKGYIELDKINSERDWNFSNVKIVVKQRAGQDGINNSFSEIKTETDSVMLGSLSKTEELYYNLILKHSKGIDITMNSFQQKVSADFENTNSFVKNIKSAIINIGVFQGYFQGVNFKKPKETVCGWAITFLIFGILIMLTGNILSYQTRLDLAYGSFFILGFALITEAIWLLNISKKFILLTQYGEDEYAKWRGLYNFLNSETLMNERTVIELVLWEQYLVYATAFGISEKVIKALNIRCPNMEISPVLRNPYFRSRSFYTSGHSFRTATRTASFTARSGGHGGYGGGGRGGGGGGGGH